VLLQAVSEVGDSREEGKDGQGGLLGYLKKVAIREEKTMLMLVGRILPLKISTEVKEIKETMTIYEAIADLKACGMDELLAFYLTRYPVGRDEGDPEWAKLIDTSLAKDPPTELAPDKDDTGSGTENTGSGTAIGRDEENTEWADMIDVSLAPDLPPTDVTPKESDTEKADMLALAESIEGAAVIQIASGDREPSRRLSEIGKRWIVDGLRLLAGSGVGDAH
jgi:hypothetical protein